MSKPIKKQMVKELTSRYRGVKQLGNRALQRIEIPGLTSFRISCEPATIKVSVLKNAVTADLLLTSWDWSEGN